MLGLICALLLVNACSSGGISPLASAIGAQILPDQQTDNAPAVAQLTRDRIAALGVALLRVDVQNTSRDYIMAAKRLDDDRVTYLGPAQRSVILRGGLIVVTHGLGFDMSAPLVDPEDPIAFTKPISAWPEEISRSYYRGGHGPGETNLIVDCKFTAEQDTQIVIVDVEYSVFPVTEVCHSDDISFSNLHFVDTTTGFVWRSRQWTGPNQGVIAYDVLEPLD